MAISNSTNRPPNGAPLFLLSRPVLRVCAWSSAEAHRLDIVDVTGGVQ